MSEKKKISLKDIGIEKLILIAIAGIVLVLSSLQNTDKKSEDNSGETETSESTVVSEAQSISTEEELENILSGVKGVGKVNVMITYKSTEESVVKEDKVSDTSDTNEEDSEGGSRTVTTTSSSVTTIYTTDANGNEVPYVVKTLLPEVEGVAVVAEGGENVEVKQEIIGIVQALFNIESHKIWVTEMNQEEK